MSTIKLWYRRNKENIKTIYIMIVTLLLIFISLYTVLISIMCADLTTKVKNLEYAITEMQYDLKRDSSLIEGLTKELEECKNGQTKNTKD